ncbi:DUF397 domain-containing protein [Streptacidiphilus sp. ASG 303]|uniref:DUF397 domain-containing protein n=1 Tax=Streptomycetaceae TaxID=2062 RepID=UPI001E474D7A|nr:DUF397 domain-containing protein [Streptacidiphilus sp. ASG 303]MCD0483393.1 DUF397 domain-containing protein [Streptacidiphilus sp. ASG 303]
MDTAGTHDGPTTWHKSGHSIPDGDCVEVRDRFDLVDVRDSKDPHGAVLCFSADAWTDFISGVRAEEFPGHA